MSKKKIIFLVIISLILIGIILIWFFIINNRNLNNKTSSCPHNFGWSNSPCTYIHVLPKQEVIDSINSCQVYYFDSDIGIIFTANNGCKKGSKFLNADSGVTYFNAYGQYITECNAFAEGPFPSDKCTWLEKLTGKTLSTKVGE
ncbi:MAG: hypothetical protein WCT08_03385 [Patescibacteria group bacterium]|jgi:hypothetical protein